MKNLKTFNWKYFKYFVIILLSLLLIASVIVIVALKNTDKKIKLNCVQKELIVGESFILSAVNSDVNEIEFFSENDEIAYVDSLGRVVARTIGETNIIVKNGKNSVECEIIVKENLEPHIECDISSLDFYVGLARILRVKFFDGGKEVVNQNDFVFSSDNEQIVEITQDGIINPISKGSAVIKVQVEYNGQILSKSLDINVSDLIVIDAPDEIYLDLQGDKSFDLSSIEIIVNGKYLSDKSAINITSDDEKVAVYDKSENSIKAVNKGKTILTIQFEDVKRYVPITVENAIIKNEINTFIDKDRYEESVNASSPLSIGATVKTEYYTDSVGGRNSYGQGFVKISHIVPPPSRTDIYTRGQRLQFNIKVMNDLKLLKANGYTKIVIPIYFKFDDETDRRYLPLWNVDYSAHIDLFPDKWTYFEYDIEHAIKDVNENNELIFYIFNYSGEYKNLINASISIYIDAIFAKKTGNDISIRYDGEDKTNGLSFCKGDVFYGKKLEIAGSIHGSKVHIVLENDDIVLDKNFQFTFDKVGSYILYVEPDDLSGDYFGYKQIPITVTSNPIIQGEVNSLLNDEYNTNYVTTSIYGLNAYATAEKSYFTQEVGGRRAYGEGFVKATMNVPDSNVVDWGSRGEGLEITIQSLNSLQTLKAKGYTKIIIPVYLEFKQETDQQFLWLIGNEQWSTLTKLYPGQWTDFVYPIDSAIQDFPYGEIKIGIANYSKDYISQMNVGIDVYLDGIFAAY